MGCDIASWSRRLAFAAVLGLSSCGGGGGGGGAGGGKDASAPTAPETAPSLRASVEDLEALGPFASWGDARSHGAVGDGVADDSAALQLALDDLTRPGQPAVLRLPAGSYRITRSLVITASATTSGLSLIGDDPATTRIVWDGPTGDPMLIVDGGFHSSFARITWDGRSRAGYGVAHWWNRNGPIYGGSVEHADEAFIDMEIGIQGGRLGADYGELDSEGQIRRVAFVRNSKAGLNLGSFNALNWWVWDSRFVDCARGVSNLYSVGDAPGAEGAGNFLVYRSVFERSTVADASIRNGGWFGLYGNVSSGSRRFFESEPIGANGARVILQGNRVLDTTDPVAVASFNLGPLMLIDNQFRSATATGPVVATDTTVAGADVVSIGNRYTVADPIRTRYAADRLRSTGDQIVDRTAIASDLPARSATPMRPSRQVFDVAVGSGAAAIQAAIDAAVAAAAAGAVNPVVHLAAGVYTIDRTLTIPAGAAIQLAGDSIASVLSWGGDADAGPMLRLAGPSRATVRDLRLAGSGQTAVAIDRADQTGGRILVVGSTMGATAAADLLHTRLSMQANTSFAALTLNRVLSALSLGVGGQGPVRLNQGSRLMLSDAWYEGPETALFRFDAGSRFSYRGGHIAPGDARFGPAPVEPAILLDGFAGQASFIGLEMNLSNAGNGIRVAQESAATEALFLGLEANQPGYFVRASGGGRIGLLSSRLRAPESATVAEAGTSDAGFLVDALAQARSMSFDDAPSIAPAGATDVRLYRLMTVNARLGLQIAGAP